MGKYSLDKADAMLTLSSTVKYREPLPFNVRLIARLIR